MGGAAGFFNANSAYVGQDVDGKPVGFVTHLTDGAKGIPAVILAQYILESFTKGFIELQRILGWGNGARGGCAGGGWGGQLRRVFQRDL